MNSESGFSSILIGLAALIALLSFVGSSIVIDKYTTPQTESQSKPPPPKLLPTIHPLSKEKDVWKFETSGAKVGQTFSTKVIFKYSKDEVNLINLKLKFPPEKLEVLDVDPTGSFINLWVDRSFENDAGEISIIGGIPKPGFKTESPTPYATIVFKAKSAGSATVSLDESSVMYKNKDNSEVGFEPFSTNIEITP